MTGLLAERLLKHGLNTSAVCSSDDVRRSKVDSGVPSLHLRDRIKAELKQAGIENARVVVVLEERDEDSLLVCRMVRQLFGVRNIIAWVQEPHNKEHFQRLGARVVNPGLSTSLLIESMILNPAVFDLAGDIAEIEIRQIKLKSNRTVGFRVDDLQLPAGVSVMSIQRSGNTLVPDNDTLLRRNDTLTLVGSSQALKKSMRIFQ
jgi:Trk K+ transport system NAD-binding subunit